ncbi:MAG: proline racemase family protein [Candidatus Aminicenantes bacterium]|nr:proline racemase family protein [Candidatus Aminicenantes bacterium]
MGKKWNPPSSWLKITTLDVHAAGEPLRIITGGIPPLPGKTILEKRRYAQNNLEGIRTSLMWEPRGHADMYGCILTEPVTPDGILGVIFLHNEGYSTMCGHAIIGLTTAVLNTGLIKIPGNKPVVKLDTPAGRVTASALRKNGIVKEVSFQNVPSFVYAMDKRVLIPEFGEIPYDIAFGGAFYAFCSAENLGLKLTSEYSSSLIRVGMAIKNAVVKAIKIEHPYEKDLSFLYGTIFVGPPKNKKNHSRNVCIFAEGELDRSPTGTGVSARAALHFSRGEIEQGEAFIVESILGTSFTGRVVKTTSFGPYPAVIPEITGQAFITGRHEFFIDPNDPLQKGFFLR